LTLQAERKNARKTFAKIFPRVWGTDFPLAGKYKTLRGIDILILLGFVGLFYSLAQTAKQWTGVLRPAIEIELTLAALPKYTFFSLIRGIIAYSFSLTFTLIYGYWAARDKSAGKILVPLLDILQSIPVLGFMPGLVIGLVTLFPHMNTGLELAAILMIFTSQVWNMTFSFYNSLCSIPEDLTHASIIYKFSTWEKFKWIELPYSAIGLIWNSMMSMAGGWFFLMVSEAFVLGNRDFRLPGIGSYMSVAVARGNSAAMLYAIIFMVIMIVFLDQFFWRPVVVWAQKFKIEENTSGSAMTSFFLEWLKSSSIIFWTGKLISKINIREKLLKEREKKAGKDNTEVKAKKEGKLGRILYWVIICTLALSSWKLVHLLQSLNASNWVELGAGGLLTLARVLATLVLGTIWTVPAGIAIGLSPKLSRIFQPIVQVVASFPAPMLFPIIILVMQKQGVSLGWGSIALMLLGTQWYILFNVIAGATAIPSDLKDAARVYKLSKWRVFHSLYLPAVFPYLITGLLTAAGGAWNASIVAEYVMFNGATLTTKGLGSLVSIAAETANFPMLAGAVFTMSAIVVIFNRLVWKKLYNIARIKYSIV